MNRKTLISFGIVGFLALVILFQNIRFKSDIPKLSQWAEPADEILVKSGDYSLHLYTKEGSWVINEQAFPADENSVGNLEMKARDIKITDLVSDQGYYEKYDLSDDKATTVIVRKGGKTLRTLMIGKSGSRSSHSFVRVDGLPGVYLAAGIQKDEFMPSTDTLREKRIFDLKSEDIESFTISSGGRTFSFYKKAAGTENAGKDAAAADSWYCKGYDNTPLDDSIIGNILYIFSPLRAVTFPEDRKPGELGSVYITVLIRSGGADYDVKIYTGTDKDYNYAVSSKNQYIFTMGKWQTEKLVIKNIKDLMKK